MQAKEINPDSKFFLILHWQYSCENFFCLDVPVKTTSELMHGETSKQSIIHWFNFCRDICTGYMLRNPVCLGGVGRNDIVEVDEALYKRKNKYHRSHDRGEGKWVFGAIERITNKVILKILFGILTLVARLTGGARDKKKPTFRLPGGTQSPLLYTDMLDYFLQWGVI